MSNNHGLRTTGRPTGNFGRAKVQGRPGNVELSKHTLSKENLVIPNQDAGFQRLIDAYNATDDFKLKATLWELLRKRKAQIAPSKPPREPAKVETIYDIIRRER